MQISFSELLIVFVVILVSITFHEAMHAYASHWLGDDTAHDAGRLTLNPLKHIDIFTTVLIPLLLLSQGLPPIGAAKPVPYNPYRLRWGDLGAAIVGAIGPFTNLVLAVIGGLALRFAGNSMSYTMIEIFALFTYVNTSFFVFNMIPLPPLDGSRVLYAIAPDWLREVMHSIENMGIFLTIGLMVLIFLTPLGSLFVSVITSIANGIIGVNLL